MLLLLYWFGMSMYAFVLFGVDKKRATGDRRRRIPERKLIAVTVLGGAVGSGLAMLLFWHKVRKKKFTVTVPIALAVTLLLAGICFYQNLHITVSEYEYAGANVPAELDGFRIVQVSDLHNQFYGAKEQLLIDRISELRPDIIVVTGDVIDKYHTNYRLALRFFEGAVKIAPVYYVTGNHEDWLSGERLTRFLSDIEALGVVLMDDKKVTLGALTLIGIADCNLANPGEELKADKHASDGPASDGPASDSGFTICLAHEPEYHSRYLRLGADITFSGHIHGGQIIIPGKGGFVSPDFSFFPELYGGEYTFREGAQSMTMYISRGLGNSILPLRINNYPELVVVTLRCPQ